MLGHESATVNDMPLTVAAALIICSLFYTVEAVKPFVFGAIHEGAAYWLTLAPHVARSTFILPVLSALYTPPSDDEGAALAPVPTSSSHPHGRLMVPLMLHVRACVLALILGPLLSFPWLRVGPSSTISAVISALCMLPWLARYAMRAHATYTASQVPPDRTSAVHQLRDSVLRAANTLFRGTIAVYCIVYAAALFGSISATFGVLLSLCETILIAASPLLYVINEMVVTVQEHAVTEVQLAASVSALEAQHAVAAARRRFIRYIFHELVRIVQCTYARTACELLIAVVSETCHGTRVNICMRILHIRP